MNLKITNNIKEANLITHSTTFHPDDVFATMFLSKLVDNPIVCRTNNADAAPKNAIVYDIGFGKFDHHQPDAKMRDEKIKYCSFGLLWQEYGHDYLKKIESLDKNQLFQMIDEQLIKQIDAIDNGVFPEIKASFHLLDLDKIIDLFNKTWDEESDNNQEFMQAVSIAEMIFDRLIVKCNAQIKANKEFEKELDNVKDGILILKKYLPYEDGLWTSKHPKASEVKVVIFPSKRGGYGIKPRTVSHSSKELAYTFDKRFYGMHDEELAQISNIKTARFVHSSGFLACSDTLEDAILLAKNAINNKE